MRTAIVSTYPPRACGIGTFAADVRSALLGLDGVDRVEKVVVVNEPSRPQRPGLMATIAQAVRGDYVRAARILGRLDVDVVLLQHEYGIFGGATATTSLSLVEELSQPLVVTLHTVSRSRRRIRPSVLAALCRQAELVIVMTETARAPARRRAARARATRFASCLTARRRCSRGARRATRSSARPETAHRAPRYGGRRAVPALDLRADLGRARGSRR